jgi:hypothetical protein
MLDDNNTKSPEAYSKTVLISHDELDASVLRDSMKAATDLGSNNPSNPEEGLEVSLILHGIFERFVLHEGRHIKLGRFEPDKRQPDELDLTPYGASERGVSRFHAQIFLKHNQLFITDLQSSNGTYIRGIKVTAYIPAALCKGDEVRLGRLTLRVMFR